MDDQQPEIDFLILADRAEAINGKLYMMGGGFDVLAPSGPGEPAQFSATIGIVVPWLATNMDHHCALRAEDADGTQLLELRLDFRVGRPPAMDQGGVQRVLFALPVSLRFAASGTHAMVATLGSAEKRARFQVRLDPPATP